MEGAHRARIAKGPSSIESSRRGTKVQEMSAVDEKSKMCGFLAMMTNRVKDKKAEQYPSRKTIVYLNLSFLLIFNPQMTGIGSSKTVISKRKLMTVEATLQLGLESQ